jgi:hypothetical protein
MPTNDPNYPSAQAIWLREKIPVPLLIISIIGLPITLYIVLGLVYVGRYEGATSMAVTGLGPWLFLYINNKGAKLAWDEDRVYMRASGWRLRWRFPWIGNLPWRALAYGDIARMDDLTLNDPGARSFLLPFQMLRLTASPSDEFTEDDIWLEALAIRDKELAPLLRQLDDRCPGMLPDIVLKQLAKWADNDR